MRRKAKTSQEAELCTAKDGQQHSRGSSDVQSHKKTPPRTPWNHLESEGTHKNHPAQPLHSPAIESTAQGDHSFRERHHLRGCDVKR